MAPHFGSGSSIAIIATLHFAKVHLCFSHDVHNNQ